MTDIVNPSPDRPAGAYITAGAIAFAGGGDNYIVDGGEPTELAVNESIDETQFGAFTESHSGSSYDVTIDPGEAFILGSWTARDTDTTVTVSSDTSGQTIYLGWNTDSPDEPIIGTDGDFSSDDPQTPLWDIDSDSSGVTSATDRRTIGYTIRPEGLVLPVGTDKWVTE